MIRHTPVSDARKLMRALLVLSVPFFVSACAQIAPQQPVPAEAVAGRPPVILVSIDGFRPDYLTRGVTPNLNALAASGARAEAMLPSFPSITFPNHYTLVTGLRPDHHGMIGNTMEDARILPNPRFKLSDRDAVGDRRWWDEAEPVWVTAEKQGVRTATLFWPGTDADIHGVRPSQWLPFDGKLPADTRVDTLLGWMDKAPSHYGFYTLYFDDVDHAGHDFGPDTPQAGEAAARVDAAIGRLLAGLKARNIVANIVVVSDHGMASISKQRQIRLDQVAPADSFRTITYGTSGGIQAQPGKEAVLAAALLKPQQHMQCWRKEDIPARYQFGHNARIPPFFCLADVGWMIFPDEERAEKMRDGGAHGYDNTAPEMNALFIASGPAFTHTVLKPFDNVDVYPMVMSLIGVKPLANDGSITPLLPALKTSGTQ
ncbi:alkaline phosphatase family protein [Undibacterium terreum]|uniref:Alkaline phosphatase family protein n=1 Tax=Undibacterium terreum TaxID=1224302 RepID=A0A916U8H7_9BURK|nr:ectonucleotide pyrophosphatase/phosphodiesterase [Undibacterium terreum]GGC63732.1 alkaline phosphatase family protein [Undibacterium terreum]